MSVTVESGSSGLNSTQALVTSTNHPGLSEYAYKRITGENPPGPEELEQVRIFLLDFSSNNLDYKNNICSSFSFVR